MELSVSISVSHSVMSDSATGLLSPWNSPGKVTGVGCYSLPQGIFPTLGLNPGLLHCRQILYHLGHQRSPNAKRGVWKEALNVSF